MEETHSEGGGTFHEGIRGPLGADLAPAVATHLGAGIIFQEAKRVQLRQFPSGFESSGGESYSTFRNGTAALARARSFPRRPLLGALSARGGHRRPSIIRPIWGSLAT